MIQFEHVKEQFSKNTGVTVPLPSRSTVKSAGYDFYTPVGFTLQPNEIIIIHTDVKIRMNDDNVLILAPRSSLGCKGLVIQNTIGVIDADYYDNDVTGGNIAVMLVNRGLEPITLCENDRFIQGVILKYAVCDNDETTTERIGGFGSTGN